MATRRSREAALADLVAGLLDARMDPATERFDAELAAAEDDGRIDPQTARVLRWWQREAQRAPSSSTLASCSRATLLALEQAAPGADREAEASAASWARATADEQPDDDGGTPPRGSAEPAIDEPDRLGSVPSSRLRHVDEDAESPDADTDDQTRTRPTRRPDRRDHDEHRRAG